MSDFKILTTKTIVGLIVFFTISLALAHAQISVTSPATSDDVRACSDYTDEVLYDRWDMNERTDLGWTIFNTVEEPYSYLTNISFSNGLFSADTVYTPGYGSTHSFANITILDSGYISSAMLGKNGNNFPINADKYTIFAIRMYVEPGGEGGNGRLCWSDGTMFDLGWSTSNLFDVHANWNIYFIDIPALGRFSGADDWEGALIGYLRLDPITVKDKNIKIDWIRLVEFESLNERIISWTGNPGNVDIYLDDDSSPANGNLGTIAEDVSGSNYVFLAGALMPGDYYVAIAPAGTTNYSYSPGYYHVNEVPILKITKPSDEGSDVDFTTVNFSDPWDMSNPEDVEFTQNITNAEFTTLTYEDLAGNAYPNQTVYYGVSEPAEPGNVGDPHPFFLHFLWRGKDHPIDANKYHNLVVKMGIEGTHSTNDGSQARVIWRNQTETVENVSQDLVLRHMAGKWMMHKIVCDLKTLPLEPGAGSPSHSGWNGLIDSFRVDPHEFSNPRAFFYDDIKLTADWTANTSFTIEWDLSDSDSNPLVSLYYDNNDSGFDGIPIVQNMSASSGPDSYTWDVSAMPAGTYWIYVEADDGSNQNRCYAGGPLIIDHALNPEIELSRNSLYFGAARGGDATTPEEILISNSGEGTLDWQATPDKSWIEVTPASDSGDGTFEVSINHATLTVGTYTGRITVQDSRASNSPQYIDVTLNVYWQGADSEPLGHFDTPVDNSTVSGSIPVTGWALDDIEVTRVEIRRDYHPDDSPAAAGPDGLVYVGDALFVQGSRPDVAAAFSDYPRADIAGWGYMMLTFGLPNRGNGRFVIYAIAYDGTGHRKELDSKVIISDNDSRIKPFGAIDTPAPGGTASGSSYTNFGWALTPYPKWIPYDGSTIWIYVDGAVVGQPVYGEPRQIIADMFPECLNKAGPVGYFYLDTTQYEDGVHTIAWSATDSDGAADGIGSRYFTIQNVGSIAIAGMERIRYQQDLSGKLRVSLESVERGFTGQGLRIQDSGLSNLSSERIIKKMNNPFRFQDNPSILNPDFSSQFIDPAGKDWDKEGYKYQEALGKYAYEVEVEELERVVVKLEGKGGRGFIGWGRDETQKLPIGSTLDADKGIFYWTPGAGFLGKHVLNFVVTDGIFKSEPITVIVNIKPKRYIKR